MVLGLQKGNVSCAFSSDSASSPDRPCAPAYGSRDAPVPVFWKTACRTHNEDISRPVWSAGQSHLHHLSVLAVNTGCYDSFRYSGWLCVCWPDDLQSDSGPAPGVEPGLQLFFDQLLHQGIVDAQVCVHLLEASVLPFQILESLQIRSLHATVFGSPLVEQCSANPQLSTDVFDRDSGLGLLDRFDDRMFTVLAFSHDTLLYGEDHAIFYLCCVRF